MIIKNGQTPDVSRMDLDQTRGSREVGATAASATGSANRTPSNDSISLSSPSGIVQQALIAGAGERAARVQQLKSQIDSNQYQTDALATSRAIINAGLAGD